MNLFGSDDALLYAFNKLHPKMRTSYWLNICNKNRGLETWVKLMIKKLLETNDTEPVFRVLRQSDWRQGLKLEPQFWSMLGIAASADKKSLSEYVSEILITAKPKNKTSYLRAYLVTWSYNKYNELLEKLRSSIIVRELHIAPVPSVTVTRDCRLFSCNAEFMEMLRKKLAMLHEGGFKPTDAKISFERPLEQIFLELDNGVNETITCSYKVIIDDHIMTYTARAAKVKSLEDNILILYNL